MSIDWQGGNIGIAFVGYRRRHCYYLNHGQNVIDHVGKSTII